jgi:hypothetical protein
MFYQKSNNAYREAYKIIRQSAKRYQKEQKEKNQELSSSHIRD